MRIRYLPLFVAALALMAGCVSPLQAGTPDGTTDQTTISVTGHGEVTADADLAVVLVSVTATADTADAARGQVAADVQQMRQALRDAGVPDDDVQTVYFRITPEYDYGEKQRELVGYEATHAFRIEAAPGDAGDVVDTAVGNGATRVDGVQFTLTDETRASLRAEALTEATTAARADADAIAEAENLELGDLMSASTSDGFGPVPMVERALDSSAGGGQTVLEPGPVTVSASVSATYAAE